MSNTKIRSNAVVTVTYNADGTMLFEVLGAGSRKFDPAHCLGALQQRAMMHGFEQRIRDAAAIPRDPLTGKSADPAEKFAAMVRVIEHLETANEWDLPRVGGGQPGDFAFAIAETQKVPMEQAREFVKGLSADEKKALSVHPPIKAVLDFLAASRVPSGMDAGSLLARLA